MVEQIEIDNELILKLREDVVALNDEISALREDNKNLRNNQRVARTVIRGLREKLNEFQNVAVEHDEQFKTLCTEDIVTEVTTTEGGLPEEVAVDPAV